MKELKALDEYYLKIKHAELNDPKSMPPEGMSGLLKRADEAYLLYGLRAYSRHLVYRLWARKQNIGFREEDFAGLKVVLAARRDHIRTLPVLEAYARVCEVLQLDMRDEATPERVWHHFIYLLSQKERLLPDYLQDYVDLASIFDAYGRVAHNLSISPVYRRMVLHFMVQVVCAKYGASWKRSMDRLPHWVLTNLIIACLRTDGEVALKDIEISLVDPAAHDGTAGAWAECVLSAYRSRLVKEMQAPTLAYCRANIAFHYQDYPEIVRQLAKIGKQSQEFSGLAIRRLGLIAFYELSFCQPGGKAHPLVQKLDTDYRAVIAKMRSRVNDLYNRQQRMTYQGELYNAFIDGFARLMEYRKGAELLPPGSIQRSAYLHERVRPVREALAKYDLPDSKWLRRRLADLQ